jgi:uncharacterized protein YjbI with pentapeptide repeats
MSTICKINNKFKNLACNLEVNYDNPDGLCILHSHQLDKDTMVFIEALSIKTDNNDYDFRYIDFPIQVSFKQKTFDNIVDFTGSIFRNGVDFTNAVFEKGVILSYSEFYGVGINNELPIGSFTVGVNFAFTHFKEKADFSNAKFATNIIFNQSEFYCDAEFYGVKIKENATFSPNIITGYANFRSAEISGILDFHPNKFSDTSKIYFTQAKISGITKFWLVHPVEAEFYYLEIEPQAKVKFESNSSLIQSKFTGTDLRLIEFNNVNWKRSMGRFVIYDEIVLRKKTSSAEYALVENLYRQLIQNYERQGDFKRVGDFHYGEMDMHRKASFWRRRIPISWYNLYWFLSGYGERPFRAFGLLIFFLAVLTGLLAWSGLEILEPKYSAGFGNPFFYLLQKVTLQRPTWAVPQGFWGNLVAGFSVLLIPGQAALFLLALRNRLGRRR